MASRRRPSKSSSPLDERQRKLLDEQEKLRARMEQLNRVIEEAPKIKAERVKARRDELLADRSTRAHHRLNSTTLADTRYDFLPSNTASRAKRRSLRSERRKTQIIFLALMVAFAVAVIWLLSYWRLQWGNL